MVGDKSLKVKKFTGRNSFSLWQINIQASLKQHGLWTPLLKPAPNPLHADITTLEEMAHSTLLLALEDHIIIEVAKVSSWNNNTDCCTWDGVTCDDFTGQVIELDLSVSRLIGIIDSNSSIFQLSHLRKLNLAHIFFCGSEISPEFHKFTHLSHLNISANSFQGRIPSEISQLNELASLDISLNYGLSIEPHVFEVLLQNMTRLRELITLRNVQIFSSLPMNLSSSLTVIDLKYSYLRGKFPYHIFELPKLQQLSLGWNFGARFTNFGESFSLESVEWNNSSSLQKLELQDILFPGKLSNSIGNLKHLTYLDLSSCELVGTLPQSLANLTHLSHLDLSSNHFTGQIPQGILGLEHLTLLDIGGNNLDLPIIPHSASNNLKSPKVLSLQQNKLTTSRVSSFLSNLTQLESIDLAYNPLYEIPLGFFELSSLQWIDLGSTQLSGPLPKSFSNLVNLRYLNLEFNNFSGPIETETLSNLVNLNYLNLGSNNLSGPIEVDALSNLVNFNHLNLSSNNFDTTLDVKFLSNFTWMETLDLSFSRISLINQNNSSLPLTSIYYLILSSCNISDLDVLRSIIDVRYAYLSNNDIHGEIPEWIWSNWSGVSSLDLSNNFITSVGNNIPLQSLGFLNLRSNLIQGNLPILPKSIRVLSLSNNHFHGEIESSICELTILIMLDLSNNSFKGALPDCIGMISDKFEVLDLHMNNLQGTIPDTFSMNYLGLNLRSNHFEGKVPRSLINCSQLQVLDLSENDLNDTFPLWLGALPNLHVLSLRSNKFHGPLSPSHASPNAFSQLQILDLSFNQLSGSLQASLFQGLREMMRVDGTTRYYFGNRYVTLYANGVALQQYHYSMTLVLNGNNMQLERILMAMTIIDLSCNHFEGEIPYSIGGLVAIQRLNLSHNNLIGQIPPQLGNLAKLQSLDLSSNQLDGNIPDQLSSLGFLSR